jgi:hypothetical protein
MKEVLNIAKERFPEKDYKLSYVKRIMKDKLNMSW